MKNFKLNLRVVITLLLGVTLLNSCENDSVSLDESVELKSIEIKELVNSFSEHFESRENLISAFEKGRVDQLQHRSDTNQENEMTIYVDMTSDEVFYTNSDLPDFYSNKQKEFLLDYFNKVANVTNGELLTEIAYYKDLLKSKSFDDDEYNQIYAVLDVGEQTVIAINEMLPKEDSTENNYSARSGDWRDFLKCMGGQGRNIARGMAMGAIVGGIRGVATGAVGGTVTLPGVGTVTGAVAGGVFGMASGAVYGAVGATFWAAADCSSTLGGSGRGCVNITGANKVCLKQLEL